VLDKSKTDMLYLLQHTNDRRLAIWRLARGYGQFATWKVWRKSRLAWLSDLTKRPPPV